MPTDREVALQRLPLIFNFRFIEILNIRLIETKNFRFIETH